MYTSLLRSLPLNTLCQMANDIDLHGAAYVDPKVTVKSELVRQLNENFNDYPGIFHDIKMNYFSTKGQPTHREDLTLATDAETGETLVVLKSLHPKLTHTPVPSELDVFEEVHCFEEQQAFQPTGRFSLTKHPTEYDGEFGMTTEWVPLDSTTFISYRNLELLNQKPYYLVKYKCKFDNTQRESLFSTYLKAILFQQSIRNESDSSEIVLLTLDGDEYVPF